MNLLNLEVIMEEKLGSIYIIKNTVNDKVYIGQTTMKVQARFKAHCKPSTTKTRGSYKLYNAMNKHGVKNFYYEILHSDILESELNELEISMIEKYDSFHNGYNSTSGGDGRHIGSITDVSKFKEMLDSKMLYSDIANYFNVNKVTVMRTAHAMEITRNCKMTKEILEANPDKTYKEIGLLVGCNAATVRRAAKKFGMMRGTGYFGWQPINNKRSVSTIPLGSTVEDELPLEAR
jgi:group I intron endonuclease